MNRGSSRLYFSRETIQKLQGPKGPPEPQMPMASCPLCRPSPPDQDSEVVCPP